MGEMAYRKGLPSKQSPFLSAGHRPTVNCSRSFVGARKGFQSRREVRERKQNFHYSYRAQSRCLAICFGPWATGIRLARSVRFCLVGVFSRLSIVILQKQIFAQLITKFLASYRTWRFTTIIWKLSIVHSVHFFISTNTVYCTVHTGITNGVRSLSLSQGSATPPYSESWEDCLHISVQFL